MTCRIGMALLPLMFLAAPAAAQDDGRRSHVPIPRTQDGDTEKLFYERMLARLSQQARSGQMNPNTLEQLGRLLRDNPQLKSLIEGAQANQPGASDQLRAKLQELLANNPGLANSGLARDVIESLKNSSAQQAQSQPQTSDKSGTSPPTIGKLQQPKGLAPPPLPAVDPQEQEARREWQRRLVEWSQKVNTDGLPGPIRNSPTLQNMLRDLNQFGAKAMGGGTDGKGMDAQLAHWQTRLRAASEWLPADWIEGLGSRLSDLPRPNISLPNFDWNVPTPSAPSLNLAAPNADWAGLGEIALVLVGVGVAAALVWRLWAVRAAPAGVGRRALGPWPLDPAAVATRGELIRAFEYLSLVRCGEAARSWHHHAIADQLGGSAAECRTAADQLAGLYEEARYAPADRPEPDWTAARHPLTFLAGVGS